MLRGGPIDLTPMGAVLDAIGWLYGLSMLLVVGLVLWKVPRWPLKVLAAAAVVIGMVYPVASEQLERLHKKEAAQRRLAESMALFEERCKTAGERIYRVVQDVDGYVWMKWRSESSGSDQFGAEDPYGHDCKGENCILTMLGFSGVVNIETIGAVRLSEGYDFIESTDPRDGISYRYQIKLGAAGAEYERAELSKQAIPQVSARYGVTWAELSTREDREHWIAGSSLKILDLMTGEVVAERIGYVIDKAQGSRAAARDPWYYARFWACPAFEMSKSGYPSVYSRSRGLVKRVLIARKRKQ